MAAQTLAGASRVDEAKRMLVDGISSARRTGNNARAIGDDGHAGRTGMRQVSKFQSFKVSKTRRINSPATLKL
jgi:hypothetical protein